MSRTIRQIDVMLSAFLVWLSHQAEALRALVLSHPRMTVKGAVAAAVYVAAHFGFHLSPPVQVFLATVLMAYLGVAGRDKPVEVE
jgi:hypothetical protein